MAGSSFGNNFKVSTFGESHGTALGAVVDGIPAGLSLSKEDIQIFLDRRKPGFNPLSTPRKEDDEVEILSGVFEGKTTGTPIGLVIENVDQHSSDYTAISQMFRPGHADYTAFEKYHGFQDYRGGGHFSGRLTAPIVAAGSICRQILEANGVQIGSHIEQLYTVHDDVFSNDIDVLKDQIHTVNQKDFATLDPQCETEMKALIEKVAAEGDSLGGIVETAVIGLPTGLGEPAFDSVESILSHLLFSVPAVKGVSFGLGFFMLPIGSASSFGLFSFIYISYISFDENLLPTNLSAKSLYSLLSSISSFAPILLSSFLASNLFFSSFNLKNTSFSLSDIFSVPFLVSLESSFSIDS